MTRHVKIYTEFLGYGIDDTMPCEISECHNTAVDVHHIIFRSKFGSKTKDEQDNIKNLIGLCRTCHDKAHDNVISKHELSRQHEIFMKTHDK